MWKTSSLILRISSIIIAIILCLVIGGMVAWYIQHRDPDDNISEKAVKTSIEKTEETLEMPQTSEKSETPKENVKEPEPVFEYRSVPQEIQDKMWGVTISEKSHVTFDDLAYLTLSYVGYDGKMHTGNLVVAKELAGEVVSIFRELYEVKFPIEKMRLPYEYDGIDELSMQDNNTSAFNDRPIEGSGALSYHQLGRAIDVNPLVNPYVRFSDNKVFPVTATVYLDRNLDETGMISADSQCV